MPANWSQAVLANHLGTSEYEIKNPSLAVKQLMQTHGKLNQHYGTKIAKVGLKRFLLSNLDKLPAVVRDAGSNMEHAEALMGLAFRINNVHKQAAGRNKMTSQTTNTSSSEPPSDGDSAEDSDHDDGPAENNHRNGVRAEGPPHKRTRRELASQYEHEFQTKSPSQPQPQPQPQSQLHSSPQSLPQQPQPQPQLQPQQPQLQPQQPQLQPQQPQLQPQQPQLQPQQPQLQPQPQPQPQPQYQPHFSPQFLPQFQPQPQPQPPSPEFDLARNIWIVNEYDHTNHGLCPASELVTKENPRISDLDFDRWILIARAQCDYNDTLHRLEYRPPPATTTPPIAIARTITIPMRTPSQWRGALNLQLQANPDRDPVFYMVDKYDSRPEPSSLPGQSPRPPSVHDGNFQIYEPVRMMSPPIKREFIVP